MPTFELGDFTLQSGETIPNAVLDYRTYGTLSAAKDNVIVFPHFLGGGPEPYEALAGWIGSGRALDSDRYFIVCPGQFGNGLSSSPGDGGTARSDFPQGTFADDVIAQERLISEEFGASEVQLVLGWSTGALQIYEWAVRFGPKVKRLACVAGAPKPSPWTRLWLNSCLKEPITSDAAWSDGDYASREEMAGAMRRVGHLTALTLPPNPFFRVGIDTFKKIGFDTLDGFVQNFWERYWLAIDPAGVVYQVNKALAADPSGGGDLQAALAGIPAKVLVVGFSGDPMFNPEDGERYASWTPGSTFVKIDSEFGHLATFSLSQADVAKVDEQLRKLLATSTTAERPMAAAGAS